MSDPIARLIHRYPELAPCEASLVQARDLWLACFKAGGKLLVAGNGGSASDAEHIVGELMKGTCRRRPLPDALRARLAAEHGVEGARLAEGLQEALPAISLSSHAALQLAIANDTDPTLVFAQQVLGYGRPGDVLLAISTSGRSANVLAAARVARTLGVQVVALTGRLGGDLAGLADVAIRVPADATDEVQERHLPVYHALCTAVETSLFSA